MKKDQKARKSRVITFILIIVWFALILAIIFLKPKIVFRNENIIAYAENWTVFLYGCLFSVFYASCCFLGWIIFAQSEGLHQNKIKGEKKRRMQRSRNKLLMVFSVGVIVGLVCCACGLLDWTELTEEGKIGRHTLFSETELCNGFDEYDSAEIAIVEGRGGVITSTKHVLITQISIGNKRFRFDFGDFVNHESFFRFISQLPNRTTRGEQYLSDAIKEYGFQEEYRLKLAEVFG